jgi:hypothetical protein
MTIRAVALVILASECARAQLPPSGSLSDVDRPLFQAEMARLEKLLTASADQYAVGYAIARTWASGKQWPQAIEWPRKVSGSGFDPSRDSIFRDLHGTREFGEILSAVSEATSPVSHSRPAFSIQEGDLAPESVAFDPDSRSFYFGSLRKGKIIRCSGAGKCEQFAAGLGVVLGLKISGGTLWALNNTQKESALIQYRLPESQAVRRYTVGAGHTLNDLTISSSGDVYLTDTRAAAVWRLAKGSAEIKRLPGRFEAANGIALSSDGGLLYVSTFPEGITVVDMKSGALSGIARPAKLCLAMIDGLYFHHGTLIAIQNGYMSPRVVRLSLSRDLRMIEAFDVLERRNLQFEGVTTGVIVGDEFFYMANIQEDKKSGFNPIAMLRLGLQGF